MPRALIADDESHLADYLAELLAKVWPELKICAKAHNGVDALRLIDEEAPDIAFLDIRMPGLSGLDVAAKLLGADYKPHIVFVTAYDQYAVDAFEREAVDYLLKPPTLERLGRTVERLKMALDKPASEGPASEQQQMTELLARLTQSLGGQAAAPTNSQRLEWIRAAHGNETRMIAIDEVCYFQANDKYISVFTSDGESLIRTPLKELLDGLDPAQFWQIHRGTVVSVKQVAATVRDFRGRTLVKLRSRPEQLVVSRAYLHLFKQM